MKVCTDEENVRPLPLDKEKITSFLLNFMPTQSLVVAYIDENDEFQFIQGNSELMELMALKTYLDLELTEACLASMYGETE